MGTYPTFRCQNSTKMLYLFADVTNLDIGQHIQFKVFIVMSNGHRSDAKRGNVCRAKDGSIPILIVDKTKQKCFYW